jgi:hypothetical protein
MARGLEGRSERCGEKPVLVADIEDWCGTEMNPQRKSGLGLQRRRGEDYVKCGRLLQELPRYLEWHWCGYVENRAVEGGALSIHMMSPIPRRRI